MAKSIAYRDQLEASTFDELLIEAIHYCDKAAELIIDGGASYETAEAFAHHLAVSQEIAKRYKEALDVLNELGVGPDGSPKPDDTSS